MADSEASTGPPPFEDVFGGDDVEQRIYGTVLRTRTPTTASTIAERVDCDPKTARKYLRWFEVLGVVTARGERPVTYERNDAYFEWRRIDRLAAEHSLDELQQRVTELTSKIAGYEEAYEAPMPADIDAITVAETSDERSIDEVYGDLADWTTARRERERFEQARQRRASNGTERV